MSIIRSFRRGVEKAFRRGFDLFIGSGLSQETLSASPEGMKYESEEMSACVRRIAAESCVLLENDGALPLDRAEPVAVLGRCQYDWFFVGYGSGGDVHAPYTVDLIDGLRSAGAAFCEPLAKEYERLCASEEYAAEAGFWGHWPFSHPEPPISEEVLRSAAEQCRTALVVIGRAAGEDRDNRPEKGSWYLTDAERRLLDTAAARFRQVVVILNIGCLMDLSWIAEYKGKLSAVLVAWLGGQESGNAVCDVLYGAASPCGRLPDTAARLEDCPAFRDFGDADHTDYAEGVFVGYRYFDAFAPDKPIYRFGHGLSYTEFEVVPIEAAREGDTVTVKADVTNTGGRPGKNAVLLFARPPEGGIEKPPRVLVSFAKTPELAPGEKCGLVFSFGIKALASFDERENAFVLEKGDHTFEANGVYAGCLAVPERETVERVGAICTGSGELKRRIEAALPEELPHNAASPSFDEVKSGAVSPADLIASLSVPELYALTRGHGMMNSPLGVPGNAGVFGGITEELRKRGVPAVSCCDGPAGLRMQRLCTLIPCGTALAATFDTAAAEELHRLLGREMRHFGVSVRLAPGMNIHRHPLCGRNFEYFSEDPTLTGLMAAAVVRGIQSEGAAACPKHFACNNQEFRRSSHDARVSVRALREIYLRGFELCVKEGRPMFIMTSYNKINGVWAHYDHDLVTSVLRGEWGFDGAVMTDWWMRDARSPEFPRVRRDAYRIRAGVDLLMPGNRSHAARRFIPDRSLTRSLTKPGGVTKAELQRSAKAVLEAILRLRQSYENARQENDAPQSRVHSTE